MMMRTISGGLAYAALVLGAGFILGVLRVSFLVPRWGERLAELAEMPLMFRVIVFSAIRVTRRFAIPLSTSARLGMGLLALAALNVLGGSYSTWRIAEPIPRSFQPI
ncbi:MAG: hypothetical protein MUD16_02695 [Desulfobacterales bacterium]|jgi:hypothetical protein|nr:hypothetical protein [Desulfobacterales bacterium]